MHPWRRTAPALTACLPPRSPVGIRQPLNVVGLMAAKAARLLGNEGWLSGSPLLDCCLPRRAVEQQQRQPVICSRSKHARVKGANASVPPQWSFMLIRGSLMRRIALVRDRSGQS